ncbi:hypothetical protein Micbo1qcDRAFT_223039 [Microdochium bolleyi]|uniref:Uncharacterized protein n=1 Tax=Microdochium bolleyi TaxID=196109 RepID=A0A136J8A4_9PEZI|nr:hypothetical protein Micbo1qcDRAFT_223039 [Microdochium bolleyi]
MASLCNYSHPERLDTAGLERTSVGTLFPYNAGLYEEASGLYGPGTIICWYLLLASFILNFIYCPLDPVTGHRRPKITAELIALTVYPVFAATDALIQSLRLLGVPGRGLVLFCLRYPYVQVDLSDEEPGPEVRFPLDLRHIPHDIVTYGQRIVALSGPIPVCDMFLTIVTLSFLVQWNFADVLWADPGKGWKPSRGSWRLISTAHAYVLACRIAVQLTAGEHFTDILELTLYDATMPATFIMLHGFGASAFLSTGVLVLLALCQVARRAAGKTRLLRAWVQRIPELSGETGEIAATVFGATYFGSIFSAVALWQGDLKITPDLGISVADADQLAALLGGALTLAFTVYSIIRGKAGHNEDGNREEMVPLAEDV